MSGIDGYDFYRFSNCTESDYWHLKTPWFWFLVIFTDTGNFVLVIMGIFLNILSFRVLNRESSDGVMSLILRFVAIFDIFVLLINGTDNICHTLENVVLKSIDFAIGVGYYHTLLWIPQSSFISIRNWCMIYLSLSRLFSIMFPFQGPRIFNRRNTKIILNLLWIIIVPATIPKFLEINAIYASCRDGWRMNFGGSGYMPVIYSWMTSVVINSLLPLVICIVSNTLLIYKIHQASNFRKNASRCGADSAASQQAERQNKATSKTVILLSCMFIVCQIPMLTYGVIVMTPIPKWLFNFTNLCGTMINNIDSSCNFFIYITTNPRFKKELINLCPWAGRIFRTPQEETSRSQMSNTTKGSETTDVSLQNFSKI